MQQTQTYRERSRHYLGQAWEELRDGDLLQASEKGWGAAAQIIKALADGWGINHRHHAVLQQIVELLVQETGDTEFDTLFDSAQGLHRNFYEGRMGHNAVERRLRRVERFIDNVEKLLKSNNP